MVMSQSSKSVRCTLGIHVYLFSISHTTSLKIFCKNKIHTFKSHSVQHVDYVFPRFNKTPSADRQSTNDQCDSSEDGVTLIPVQSPSSMGHPIEQYHILIRQMCGKTISSLKQMANCTTKARGIPSLSAKVVS